MYIGKLHHTGPRPRQTKWTFPGRWLGKVHHA